MAFTMGLSVLSREDSCPFLLAPVLRQHLQPGVCWVLVPWAVPPAMGCATQPGVAEGVTRGMV